MSLSNLDPRGPRHEMGPLPEDFHYLLELEFCQVSHMTAVCFGGRRGNDMESSYDMEWIGLVVLSCADREEDDAKSAVVREGIERVNIVEESGEATVAERGSATRVKSSEGRNGCYKEEGLRGDEESSAVSEVSDKGVMEDFLRED